MSTSSFGLGDSEPSMKRSSVPNFRLSICLKNYFNDVRAKCYILITRKRSMRRIRWLERRIQKLFHIPGSFYLTTKDHFLPSSERLALLCEADQVEVIPNEIGKVNLQENKKSSFHCNALSNENHDNNPSGKDIPDSNSIHERLSSVCDNVPSLKDNKNTNLNESNEQHLVDEQDITGIINNTVDVTPQFYSHDLNCYKEQPDGSQSLEQLKESALALLDDRYCTAEVTYESSEMVETSERPRKRRRVRRRRRCRDSSPVTKTNTLDLIVSTNQLENPLSENEGSQLNNTGEYPENVEIGQQVNDTCGTDASTAAMSNLIARNEDSFVRKPRVIRSLVETTS